MEGGIHIPFTSSIDATQDYGLKEVFVHALLMVVTLIQNLEKYIQDGTISKYFRKNSFRNW
jgi:hypothetical protein